MYPLLKPGQFQRVIEHNLCERLTVDVHEVASHVKCANVVAPSFHHGFSEGRIGGVELFGRVVRIPHRQAQGLEHAPHKAFACGDAARQPDHQRAPPVK